MKSKKMTYVLAAVTVLLWGAIIYRVVAALAGDQVPAVFAEPPVREHYDDYKLPKDTARLHGGYGDPFGMAMTKAPDTPRVQLKTTATRSITLPFAVPTINWAMFNYRGYVRNAGSRKLIAVLLVNGKEVTLSEGESAGEVKLLKNMGDSVKLSYHGKTKFIPLNPATL